MEKGAKLNEKEKNVPRTKHDEKYRCDQNENHDRYSICE